VSTTVDLEIVGAFDSTGMSPAHAMKAAAAFSKSDNNRLGRVEDDLKDLKSDVKRMDVRGELHTWILGFMVTGIATLIIKAFFH